MTDTFTSARKRSSSAVYANNQADPRQLLVESTADVNYEHYSWGTPLHCAAEVGAVSVAKVLLKHGADVFAFDESGSTLLKYVSQSLKLRGMPKLEDKITRLLEEAEVEGSEVLGENSTSAMWFLNQP